MAYSSARCALMVKTPRIPAVYLKKYSTTFKRRLPPTGRNSIWSATGRFTVITGGRESIARCDRELVAQGMMGGAKAHYDGIVAFSQTDFTEDLKKISVPTLVMHGDDDQIVPYADPRR